MTSPMSVHVHLACKLVGNLSGHSSKSNAWILGSHVGNKALRSKELTLVKLFVWCGRAPGYQTEVLPCISFLSSKEGKVILTHL